MKLELTLPNIEEQQKIAKVLSTADQEIEALQHKLDCLQQEKKALMQQLLTGKRRVKVTAWKAGIGGKPLMPLFTGCFLQAALQNAA